MPLSRQDAGTNAKWKVKKIGAHAYHILNLNDRFLICYNDYIKYCLIIVTKCISFCEVKLQINFQIESRRILLHLRTYEKAAYIFYLFITHISL